jgi:hypothetical protein
MLFVGRADGLRILNTFDAGTYTCTGAAAETPADTDAPATGTPGLTVEIGSQFDGWGYAHLYDANTSEELDAYAISEGIDARYATGFGALTIHEVATDPTTNLAYLAYYNGGMRVVRYSRTGGIEEMGKFIDDDGSNFWGVEQFTDAAGNRLIAGSDRDFGLQIFKYTGPGAVLAPPPPPPPPVVAPPPPPPVVVPPPPPAAKRPLSMFRFGSFASLIFSSTGRASVTLQLPGRGSISALVRATIGRRTVVIARTSRSATAAGNLRLTFQMSATNTRLLRRTLARRPTGRTSGVLRVSFTPTGGMRRTRNKALSIGMR